MIQNHVGLFTESFQGSKMLLIPSTRDMTQSNYLPQSHEDLSLDAKLKVRHANMYLYHRAGEAESTGSLRLPIQLNYTAGDLWIQWDHRSNNKGDIRLDQEHSGELRKVWPRMWCCTLCFRLSIWVQLSFLTRKAMFPSFYLGATLTPHQESIHVQK